MQNSGGYQIEIFSSSGNQNMRYRVIETYRPENHHPFVRALKSNHGQELIQVDPDCNNVFYYKKLGQGEGMIKKVLDINGKHRALEDSVIPSLNLDFSNNKVRNSKRVQLADDDRNVEVRLQRYCGEEEGAGQKTVIEVWNQKKYQEAFSKKNFEEFRKEMTKSKG